MIEGQPFQPVRNIEAEADLLGAMLVNGRWIDYAADRLKPADFFEPTHATIFEIIVQESAKGNTVSPVTLKPYLENDEGLKELGGLRYLARLTGNTSLGIGFETQCAQVKEMSQRRKMQDGLEKAVLLAVDMEQPIEAIVSAADAAVSAEHGSDGVEQLTGLQCIDNLFDSYNQPNYGVKSNVIPALDRVMGLIRPKELIILAARPGMGKTACALSYAIGASQGGYGVLFVSLEMSGTELAARMVSDMCFNTHNETGVFYSKIRDNKCQGRDRDAIKNARRMMNDMPFRVVDAGKLTTGRLSMIIMRTKRRMEAQGQSLDLVVVDYLQLLSPDTRTGGLYEKVSEISMALKAAAKTHNVGIMALAQLSRQVESREGKRPQLSDLRDSGQIEQDADTVLFLLRDEYYHKQTEPEECSPEYPAWLEKQKAVENGIEYIIAKRRNGPAGTATGRFYGAFQAVR